MDAAEMISPYQRSVLQTPMTPVPGRTFQGMVQGGISSSQLQRRVGQLERAIKEVSSQGSKITDVTEEDTATLLAKFDQLSRSAGKLTHKTRPVPRKAELNRSPSSSSATLSLQHKVDQLHLALEGLQSSSRTALTVDAMRSISSPRVLATAGAGGGSIITSPFQRSFLGRNSRATQSSLSAAEKYSAYRETRAKEGALQ